MRSLRIAALARSSCRVAAEQRSIPAVVVATTTAVASFHSSAISRKNESNKNWADPVARQYKFWNPQSAKQGQYSFLIEMSPESIVAEAKIVSLSAPVDPANTALHKGKLPLGATLLGVGTTVDEVKAAIGQQQQQQPNVLFVSPSCPRAAIVLPEILTAYPSIEWVHCRSAGIDFVESDDFAKIAAGEHRSNNNKILRVTNAKGQFSSSLAEYALAACSYFSKDFARLARQQKEKKWQNYDIEDLCVHR